MSGLGFLDWSIFCGYLVVVFALGIALARGQRDNEDYFVGGRRMNWAAVGVSLFATAFNSLSFVALPAAAAFSDYHLLVTYLAIGLVITPLLWWVFVPVYLRLRVTSVYEYLEIRFNRRMRKLGTLLFALYAIGWMGSMVYATGLILQAVLGLDATGLRWTLVAVGAFATLYTALGGIRAVIWTDVLQAITLGGGMLIVLLMAIHRIDGGFGTVVRIGLEHGKFEMFDFRLDLTKTNTFFAALSLALFAYLPGYTTSQITVQRYLCMPGLAQARRALLINAVVATLIAGLFFFVGTTQLANDDFCSVPEFTGVAIRMGKRPPPVILGTLENDPVADAELADWCDVAKVLHDLRGARIGHFGHVLESMLDMHSDPTAFTAAFGCHVVQTEPDDLVQLAHVVTDAEIDDKKARILEMFDTPDPKSDSVTRKLTAEDLETAARVAVALDKFVDKFDLDGLAYYYEGQPDSEVRQIVTNLIVGNSLLTAAGFPMCGESDLKTCVAMLILDRLDIGGSFAEFHPIDFNEGFVLVGHDGPHHVNIAEGKPVLRSLTKYHGKPGSGASVEFKIKEGPITMLSLGITASGKFKFVIAEGESVGGPIPPTGNTNTRAFFQPDVRTFLTRWVAAGPTHHFALGVGHRAHSILKIADALDIESTIMTEVS